MRKIKIGVDIDDTICYLGKFSDDIISEKIKEKLNFREYSYEKRYFFEDGTSVPIEKILDIIYNDLDWLKVPVIKDAVKYIKRLQNDGHEIHFITHRSEKYTPNAKTTTINYLNKYFDNYRIHFVKNKEIICYNNNIKVMIDNDHRVLEKIEKYNLLYGGDVTTMFYVGAMPTIKDNKTLREFKTWKDIYSEITSMCKCKKEAVK